MNSITEKLTPKGILTIVVLWALASVCLLFMPHFFPKQLFVGVAMAGIAAALWFRQSWAWWIVMLFHTLFALGISLILIGAAGITLLDFCIFPRGQGRVLTANQLKGVAGLAEGSLVAWGFVICLIVKVSRNWCSREGEGSDR